MDPVVEARRVARPLHGQQDLDEVLARTSRARYVLIGFGTHRGSVVASDFWGGPVRRMPVPEARPGSVEDLLHEAVPDGDSLLLFPGSSWASQVRGHRAIGVVYHPRRERMGNYVPTILDQRYDAFVHCDHTTALRPLHQVEFAEGEIETYPYAE